jgi:hypothetical protein
MAPDLASAAVCPPHHWQITGTNTGGQHQQWTCYRCGTAKPPPVSTDNGQQWRKPPPRLQSRAAARR